MLAGTQSHPMQLLLKSRARISDVYNLISFFVCKKKNKKMFVCKSFKESPTSTGEIMNAKQTSSVSFQQR